jgi:hypothetical protein
MLGHQGKLLALAVGISFAVCPSHIYGQCPPSQALAEDRVLQSVPLPKLESDQHDAGQDALHGKAQFKDVTIEGAPDLQDSIKAEIDDRLKQWGSKINSDVVGALAEGVRDVLQNNGYFHAKVSTETSVSNADPAAEQVSLTFRVSEGQEYRLGQIQFANAASSRLYDSVGYINFTASPVLSIDNTHQRISVTFKIAEDEQFRVRSFKVLGLNPENSDKLVIRLKPGDIFNRNLIGEFYKDNQSVIPGDALLCKEIETNQDNINHTAAVVLDLRGCQEPPSSTD